MNFKIVNELINNKNGKDLAKLFNFGVDLSGVKTSKIYSPFEDLFKKQQLFFEIRTYENAEEVVKSAFYVLDEGDYTYYLAKKVIMNCLSFIYNENENKNKETLAKTLASFTKVSNDIRYYAFNVLSQLYFEMSKFELLENLLLVSSNTRQRKLDFYVYNLYKGITLFYLDRFKESFISLSIAFKSKRLKTFCAFPYFLCAMLNGKIVKKEVLIKYNCESLAPLSLNLKHGKFKQISFDLKDLSNNLIEFYIFRSCYTYLPLIAFRNLIKGLYFMFSIEAKLEIEKITEAAGLETLEVYSLITSLIDLDLIKGYVSVNRKIIVFSKVDPFPNEINL